MSDRYHSVGRLVHGLIAVSGSLTLACGSPLSAHAADEFRPLVIAAAQPTPPSGTAPRAPALPETEVVADPQQPTATSTASSFPRPRPTEPVRIPSVLSGSVFQGSPTTGYFAPDATVGGVVAIPNRSFPGTITTVTDQLRRDQQAISFDDILRDIGGANKTVTDTLRPDQFTLRGLDVTAQNFRKNGFLDQTYTPRDFANVERVDILKGPASILYGSAQPAGTVNVVTKKAIAGRNFDIGGFQTGSYGLQRYTIDSNHALNADGTLIARVNAAYQNNDTFRDTGFNERVFVSPTVTWVIDDDTALTWEGEYHQDRRRFDTGLIAVNGDARAFAPGTFFGDPNDLQVFHDYRSTLSLTRQLNDNWSLYVGGTTLFYDYPSTGTIPQAYFGAPAGSFYTGGPVNRSVNVANPAQEQNEALIANLSGDVTIRDMRHRMVFGTEQDWFIVGDETFATSIPGVDNPQTINPFAPGPFPTTQPNTQSFAFNNHVYRQNRHAVYFQDLVDVTDRLHVLFGGRFDHLDLVYDRNLTFGGVQIFQQRTDQSFDQGTTRVGIVYDVIPEGLSAYAMYATSFNPPPGGAFGSSVNGQFQPTPINPELGRIWEGGFKARLLDNLTYTIGGFYINRTNVATSLGAFNSLLFVQADQQRSQGMEMNLNGQWSQRLSTVANWTYSDVVQSDANNLVSGRVRGVPLSSGNIWTRYNLRQTQQETVGVALGVVAAGQRRGDYNSPLVLNGYDRWDTGFFYRYGRWDSAIYWENMFNRRYETGSINQYQVFSGAPSNFRFQISATF